MMNERRSEWETKPASGRRGQLRRRARGGAGLTRMHTLAHSLEQMIWLVYAVPDA